MCEKIHEKIQHFETAQKFKLNRYEIPKLFDDVISLWVKKPFRSIFHIVTWNSLYLFEISLVNTLFCNR
jgi:hypothetical protein